MGNGAVDASIFVRFQPILVHQYVEGGHQVAQMRFKPTPGDVLINDNKPESTEGIGWSWPDVA